MGNFGLGDVGNYRLPKGNSILVRFFGLDNYRFAITGKCAPFAVVEITTVIEFFFQAGPCAMESYFYIFKRNFEDVGDFFVL